VDFPGFTGAADTIEATWTLLAADGTEEVLQVQMVETEPESNLFVYGLGVKNIFEVKCPTAPATVSHTSFPVLVRIAIPEGLVTGHDVSVDVFASSWGVKLLDLGDGQFWYIVDERGMPTVFLPSAYAESSSNVKAQQERIGAIILYGRVAKPIPIGEMKMGNGLVVGGDEDISQVDDPASKIDDLIRSTMKNNLRNWEKKKIPDFLGKGPSWVYTVEKGKTLEPIYDPEKEEEVLRTEILWRYISNERTIAHFLSKTSLERDFEYRLFIVAAAKGATFDFVDPQAEKPRFNYPVFWKFPHDDIVSDEKTASQAIGDMWKNPSKYGVGCDDGARFCALRAASQVRNLSGAFDKAIGKDPDKYAKRVLADYYTPPGTENWKNRIRLTAWLPGDYGYVNNTRRNDNSAAAGENVIYLGGCFKKDLTFVQEAVFWGHLGANRTRTLQQWINNVSNAFVTRKRTSLLQPFRDGN
jgi:hypothetical protein